MYRESDNYTDLSYTGELKDPFSGVQSTAVKTNFQQKITFESDAYEQIDTPMYLTNQALFGAWYSQNAAQANDT